MIDVQALVTTFDTHWPTPEEFEAGRFDALYEESVGADWRMEEVLLGVEDIAKRWGTDSETAGRVLHELPFGGKMTLSGERFLTGFDLIWQEKQYPELREGRFEDAITRWRVWADAHPIEEDEMPV
jgi:hypothetical protein